MEGGSDADRVVAMSIERRCPDIDESYTLPFCH